MSYLKNGKSKVTAENGVEFLKIMDMINKTIKNKGGLIEKKNYKK